MRAPTRLPLTTSRRRGPTARRCRHLQDSGTFEHDIFLPFVYFLFMMRNFERVNTITNEICGMGAYAARGLKFLSRVGATDVMNKALERSRKASDAARSPYMPILFVFGGGVFAFATFVYAGISLSCKPVRFSCAVQDPTQVFHVVGTVEVPQHYTYEEDCQWSVTPVEVLQECLDQPAAADASYSFFAVRATSVGLKEPTIWLLPLEPEDDQAAAGEGDGAPAASTTRGRRQLQRRRRLNAGRSTEVVLGTSDPCGTGGTGGCRAGSPPPRAVRRRRPFSL